MTEPKFRKTKIGNIPVDWSNSRIGNHCDVLSGGTPNSNIDEYYFPPEIPWLKSGDVNLKKITSATNYISKLGLEKSSAKLLPRNSIIIGLSGRGKTRGMVSLLEIESSCNQNLACIIPNDNLNYKFLFYFLEYKYEYIRNFTGDKSRNILNLSLVKSIPIIIPKIKDQKEIACILENVDNLIQTTLRLIEKLQECKKGLMQRLFTEGIGHNKFKKFKKWKIPNQWKICALKNLLEKIQNGTSSKQNQERIGFPVTRIETISDARIDAGKIGYVNSLSHIEQKNLRLIYGDILFSNINSKKHIGKTGFYEGYPPILYHGMNLLLLRANKKYIIPKFLHYELVYLKSLNIFQNMSNQAVNQASINQTDLGRIKIFLPGIDEQRTIIQILLNLDKKIENEIKFKKSIKNIKKGLMQVLLTGKKRVLKN